MVKMKKDEWQAPELFEIDVAKTFGGGPAQATEEDWLTRPNNDVDDRGYHALAS